MDASSCISRRVNPECNALRLARIIDQIHICIENVGPPNYPNPFGVPCERGWHSVVYVGSRGSRLGPASIGHVCWVGIAVSERIFPYCSYSCPCGVYREPCGAV